MGCLGCHQRIWMWNFFQKCQYLNWPFSLHFLTASEQCGWFWYSFWVSIGIDYYHKEWPSLFQILLDLTLLHHHRIWRKWWLHSCFAYFLGTSLWQKWDNHLWLVCASFRIQLMQVEWNHLSSRCTSALQRAWKQYFHRFHLQTAQDIRRHGLDFLSCSW